jgi:hypothetical protein
MDITSKEKTINFLIKKYLKIDNNIFISDRLFIAKSAVNWIFQNSKHPTTIKHYIEEVEKYLEGKHELKWSNGVLIKKKANKDEKNNKEKN